MIAKVYAIHVLSMQHTCDTIHRMRPQHLSSCGREFNAGDAVERATDFCTVLGKVWPKQYNLQHCISMYSMYIQ